MYKIFRISLLFFFLLACAYQEQGEEIRDRIYSPVGIVFSPSGHHLYVINANFDARFNTGSLVTMTEEGRKVFYQEIPRLATAVEVIGKFLFIATAAQERTQANIFVYGLADEARPKLLSSRELPCSVINIVQAKDIAYPYIGMACKGGGLLISTKPDARHFLTIHHVREYMETRRAMFIDSKRGKLFAFPTSLDAATAHKSTVYVDKVSSGREKKANGIPDAMENFYSDKRARRTRHPFQYIVYDITKAVASGFSKLALDHKTVQDEHHFIHFNLENLSGDLDDKKSAENKNTKFYRTNFWQAVPSPESDDLFYLSQRGEKTIDNNILEVKIKEENGKFYLDFVRKIYNDDSITDEYKRDYLGDFKIVPLSSDHSNYIVGVSFQAWDKKKHVSSSLFVLKLDNTRVVKRIYDHDLDQGGGFFQVTMNQEGDVFSCGFYTHTVEQFKILSGPALSHIKTIL